MGWGGQRPLCPGFRTLCSCYRDFTHGSWAAPKLTVVPQISKHHHTSLKTGAWEVGLEDLVPDFAFAVLFYLNCGKV